MFWRLWSSTKASQYTARTFRQSLIVSPLYPYFSVPHSLIPYQVQCSLNARVCWRMRNPTQETRAPLHSHLSEALFHFDGRSSAASTNTAASAPQHWRQSTPQLVSPLSTIAILLNVHHSHYPRFYTPIHLTSPLANECCIEHTAVQSVNQPPLLGTLDSSPLWVSFLSFNYLDSCIDIVRPPPSKNH